MESLDFGNPVDRVDEDLPRGEAGQFGIQARAARHPLFGKVEGAASRGVWKPTSDRMRLNAGRNTAPPRSLFLRSASSFSVILVQYSSNRVSCSGVPVMTTERRPLRMDSTGA